MFGATDPVSVVALLKELGAPGKFLISLKWYLLTSLKETLSTLIEGESLLNDGVGFVLFLVFFEQISGMESYGAGDIVVKVLLSSFGGTLVGIAMGVVGLVMLQQVWEDSTLAVSITICVVYGTFFISEAIGVSGVVGVVFVGLVFTAYRDGYIMVQVHDSLKRFWSRVEYIVTTILFVYSGVVVVDVMTNAESTGMTGRDIANLVTLYILINVIRWVINLLFYPVLKHSGYGMDMKKCLVLSYSGLRGAVGLIGAILVVQECSCQGETRNEDEICIPAQIQKQMMFHMAGIVLLTLSINGTTCKYLVSYLELNKQSSAAQHFFDKATMHVHGHMTGVLESLKRHPHYKSADFQQVWKAIPVLSRHVYQERHEQGIAHSRDTFTILKELDKMNSDRFTCVVSVSSEQGEDRELSLQEARYRFMGLIKASYRKQFSEGANRSWPILQVLIEAASRAQDRLSQPINEWEDSIKHYVESRRIALYKTCGMNARLVALLAEAYDTSVTFIRAHKSVVKQFSHLSHQVVQSVVDQVLEENALMIEQALSFSQNFEIDYPEVAQSVITNIAIQRLLKEMESFAHQLLEHAEIDEKDLHVIETALERSRHDLGPIRHPSIPTREEILRNSSFMLDLNVSVADLLLASSHSSSYAAGTEINRADTISMVLKGKLSIEMENGSLVERNAGDVFGCIEFLSRMSYTKRIVANFGVEILSFSSQTLKLLLKKDVQASHNICREAGLLILDSLYPHFQYASYDLLKTVLPQIRVVQAEKQAESKERSSLEHEEHPHRVSLVQSQKPITFRGGLVIPLTGVVRQVDGKELRLLVPHDSTIKMVLAKDAIVMHVPADTLNLIESFNNFESRPSMSVD